MLKLKFLLLLLFLIILPIKLASSSDNLNERSIDNLEDHDAINNLEERAPVSPNSPNSLNDDDFDKRDTSPANILEKRRRRLGYKCGRQCYFGFVPYYFEGYALCYPNCGCRSACNYCYCNKGGSTQCKCTNSPPSP